ncbi:uncharacterized protein LOC127809330 [Diospyros lotus]|uniref:uncharacterized protein LOC127809330 n=1 Tax=Diospyros lotus TaxID=55363 RepID=UPI00224D2805|nr:uncharacterized protein LOC127809330 [Diospyros lotus]
MELKLENKNFQDSKRCPRCKKNHLGRKCLTRSIHCFVCVEEGHMGKDCPKRKETPPMGNPGRIICFKCEQLGHIARECLKRLKVGQADGQTEKIGEARWTRQGRVFNLIKEDAGVDPAVIQGTLLILKIPVHALIDPGSTHSFISDALVRSLGIETKPLGHLMIISTSMEKTMETSKLIEDCKFGMSGDKFQANLILLDVNDFDVILWMDFLSKYDANMDCQRKMVTIRKPGEEHVKFWGQSNPKEKRIISAHKVARLMNKGAYGYLASAQLVE